MTEIIQCKISPRLMDELNAMNKKELIERTMALVIELDQAKSELRGQANALEVSEERLLLAQDYTEQGKAMIEAIIQRWYDV